MPDPADGATTVWPSSTLTWLGGTAAYEHHLYLGEDMDLVRQGAVEVDKGVLEDPGFDPNGLAEATMYYWRVDEISLDSATEGEVWSFTTVVPVEDFESYSDDMDAGEAVFQTWLDGIENGTGSVVGYFESVNGTFNETGIVHGGGQSMPLDYNNVNAPHYSETERTFDPAQNWTTGGVETLVLNVRGRPANDAAPLYVTIQDSADGAGRAVYPDGAVVKNDDWVEWQIPFSTFIDAGVNMAAVKTMVIGVGDPDNPVAGPTGLLYIDDIALAISGSAQE